MSAAITTFGRIAGPATIKTTDKGIVSELAVYTNGKRRQVALFGEMGKRVAERLATGDFAKVVGQLRAQNYTGKDGQAKTAEVIYASQISLIKAATPKAESVAELMVEAEPVAEPEPVAKPKARRSRKAKAAA